MDLVLNIISGLLDPFLGYKDLLGDLDKNNVATLCEQDRERELTST